MPHADTDIVQAYHPGLDTTITINYGALDALSGWELTTPAPEDVSTKSAKEVLAYVETNPDKAAELLVAEQAKDSPRKTVVEGLQALNNDGGNA